MRTAQQIDEIISALEKEYPDAQCSLQYQKDYELLFATRLAAQCTDERVNKQTPALYSRYPSLEDIAGADIEELEEYIRPCGFYHSKARDIVLCANALLERHRGRVPDTMEELTALPGVGRKTANLILGDVFGKPAYVVDTHCIRLTNRIGIVDGLKEPEKIEAVLRKTLPPDKASKTLKVGEFTRARIVGDVEYASIEMHQGAVIEGRLVSSPASRGELTALESAKDN